MAPPVLLLLLLLSALLLPSATPTSPALDGWYPCALSVSSAGASAIPRTQCAIFKAPLCYSSVCHDATNRSIDVFVKRLTSSKSPFSSTNPSFVVIQGGPGASTSTVESSLLSLFSTLNGNVNIYAIDHRGTGRSTKFDCVAAQAQATSSPGGLSISPEEVASCADELQSSYGSDLSSFSTTSAASDIRHFVRTYLNGSQTFVYGANYGSAVVERLMHLNATEISGYVLDAVGTSSHKFYSDWDVDFGMIAEDFLALCAKNRDDCGKYFDDKSVYKTLEELLVHLSDSSAECTDALTDQLERLHNHRPDASELPVMLRHTLGDMLRRPLLRKLIPIVVYRLSRCTSDDVDVLGYFFDQLKQTLTQSSTDMDSQIQSNLLTKLVIFSEFWESPTPTERTMNKRLENASITTGTFTVQTYCAFTKEDSPACREFSSSLTNYSADPIVYNKDKYWDAVPELPRNTSVLLLSSLMNPRSPARYASDLHAALQTTNKQLVTIDSASDAVFKSTSGDSSVVSGCGVTVVASYVASRGNLAQLNTTCVSTASFMSLHLSTNAVTTWLSSSAAFDGEFTGNSTSRGSRSPMKSSYLMAFIALGVLLVLAVIVACVFIAKWHRARHGHDDALAFHRMGRRGTVCADDSIEGKV